jgi:hypothetical protein
MLKYYREFFSHLGKGFRRYVPLVILGAVLSGLLEITGLLLLLPFIRILVRPEAIEKHRWLGGLMRIFHMETPLQQVCFLGSLIVVIFVLKNIYLMAHYYWQNRILRRHIADAVLSVCAVQAAPGDYHRTHHPQH